MLSPEEFIVGAVENATPGSLILPRTTYEETILIGEVEGAPTAVFLSGQFRFACFPSSPNNSWGGIIIPGIRVEADETTLSSYTKLGTVVRMDIRFVVYASSDRFYGRVVPVTISAKLPPCIEGHAGFTKWQIVLGYGEEKRVLARIDIVADITS